jgi:hypothetical protein
VKAGWKIRAMIWMGFWQLDLQHEMRVTDDEFLRNLPPRIEAYAGEFLKEIFSFLLLVISIFLAVFSLALDIAGFDNDWFQRSGAVVVGASLFVSFFRFEKAGLHPCLEWTRQGDLIRQIFKGTEFFCCVLGTLIWAYGDLFVDFLLLKS